MADEALACFVSILESVPGWIAELEGTLRTATKKQNEILSENQPSDSEPCSPRKRSKISPLRSRRSKDSVKHGEDSPTLLRPQLPHLTGSDALRLSQRKRKTASVCSAEPSGPSKYRSRSMVVVYYDGDVQKRFERLVRAVGTSRNVIRKGKMSAKVDNLSRTGSSSSEASSSAGEDRDMALAKLNYKSARPRKTGGNFFGKDDSTEAFDKVDSFLEKGQTLCERAAHQILRDGDCALELENAKEHFTSAHRLVEAELPLLRKKAARATERRRRSNERRGLGKDANVRTDKAEALDVKVATVPPILPLTDKLEVDLEANESEDDADFNVNALPLNKYQMSSTRLLA